MLTIPECRTLVGTAKITDEELENLRDDLYRLAHIFIEEFQRNDMPRKDRKDTRQNRMVL